MTQSDLYHNLQMEIRKAVDSGFPLIQIIGTLESIKMTTFYCTSKTAPSLCGDAPRTASEPQTVAE